jgi:glyoxylase-like metal-dependent hydrolase (beta-lactamase superfamily II)/rhodanese-related sulfurtransferase
MNITPFVHEGLGNSSYLVELVGDGALLVDPDRTVDRYLRAAEERGRKIVAVLETHLHADFVSGSRELGHAVAARVYATPEVAYGFPVQPVPMGQRIALSGVEVESIASPGHTPEHVSFVLRTAERSPPVLFSGGSVIVGGAARTDLLSPDQTEGLSRAQYRTLKHAFESLPDETELFPTHGGGSFCSAGGGKQRTSTLGDERRWNEVMRFDGSEDEFARWFPTTFPGAPDYFFRMRPINQRGPRLRSEISMPLALDVAAFDAARAGALVIDVRQKEHYSRAHIPGSLSDPFREQYAVWLGWLLPADTPLLFVVGDEPLDQVIDETLLVGYERLAGWLRGGMEAWEAAGRVVEAVPLVSPEEARRALVDGAAVLDVREPTEYALGRVDGALHISLGHLQDRVAELPADRPIVAYCGHGERASSAASILKRSGREALNLDGGFEAWQEAGFTQRR